MKKYENIWFRDSSSCNPPNITQEIKPSFLSIHEENNKRNHDCFLEEQIMYCHLSVKAQNYNACVPYIMFLHTTLEYVMLPHLIRITGHA
jgi:hypothetical protein